MRAHEPPFSQQLVGLFVMTPLRWLFTKVLGRWPYEGATWLWRMAFDRPEQALLGAAPVIGIVVGVWLLAMGARHGYWLDDLAHAWHREEIATLNAATVVQVLADCDRRDPRGYAVAS